MNTFMLFFASVLLMTLIFLVVLLIFEVRASRKESKRHWDERRRKENAEAEYKKSYDILYIPKSKNNMLGGSKSDNMFRSERICFWDNKK